MAFYRRRLPHLSTGGQSVFITWCLHGSLPPNRVFPETLTSGEAFERMDRMLDEVRSGPFHLRQPEVAGMVVETLHYNADVLGHYDLHAFVVMPNHVHLLVSPLAPLPKLTRSLKGITAKRANAMLHLTGSSFWQEESYDHMVRGREEFARISLYIEQNPVRAGLVQDPSEFPWSSAAWATGGSPADQVADQGVRPTWRLTHPGGLC
jgi:putative DNA methylase